MGKYTPNGGSLKDYRTLMLKLLEKIEDNQAEQRLEIKEVKKEILLVRTKDIPTIQQDVAVMKTENRLRVDFVGFLGGLLPSVAVAIYFLVNRLSP